MKKTKELVILYHFTDAERVENIRSVLRQMKIEMKEVSDADAGQKIGFLIGAKGFSVQEIAPDAEGFSEEMLILHGIDRKRLDALLAAFTASGVGKVALKAMVTPHNMFWSLRRLGQTIQKEHHVMAKGQG